LGDLKSRTPDRPTEPDEPITRFLLVPHFGSAWRTRTKYGREYDLNIFNIVAEWDDIMRYRHLAGGLSKAGWTVGQIEKALGGNLMRVYVDTFG